MLKRLPEIINHGGQNFSDKLAAFKSAGVKIHPLLWDIMYLYLSDHLSVINLLTGYYIKKNEPVLYEDGLKIQAYNRKANILVDKIINPAKIQDNEHEMLKIKDEALKLSPEMRNFLGHWVNNRLHAMGFNIDSHIDPKFPEPISIEHTVRIYDDSSQIIGVLEHIRAELQDQRVGF